MFLKCGITIIVAEVFKNRTVHIIFIDSTTNNKMSTGCRVSTSTTSVTAPSFQQDHLSSLYPTPTPPQCTPDN